MPQKLQDGLAGPTGPPAPSGPAQARHERIRRVKKWLRPLPRRATMHRYPVLKWFAVAARKRSYLWSFRASEAIPAIYAGWLLSLAPLMGVQSLLVVAVAFVLRCNIMIPLALILITNPLTAVPIYGFTYLLGAGILQLFGMEVGMDAFKSMITESELRLLEGAKDAVRAFAAMTLGGLVVGYVGAVISAQLYRRAARHYAGLADLMKPAQRFALRRQSATVGMVTPPGVPSSDSAADGIPPSDRQPEGAAAPSAPSTTPIP